MEAVIGAPARPAAFDAFLARWEAVQARSIAAAAATLGAIPGVTGLILAGGLGRGAGGWVGLDVGNTTGRPMAPG